MDRKLRFQNSSFRQQLKGAREYKRVSSRLPETRKEKVLSTVGLGTIRNRILLGLFFAIIIYIVYVPNIFFIKTIEVRGLEGPKGEILKQTAVQYFENHVISSQKNLLTLSTDVLKKELEKNGDIEQIKAISKQFPNTLLIEVKPRLNEFLMGTPEGLYYVSSDGVITGKAESATSSPQKLISLMLPFLEAPKVGERVLNDKLLGFMDANKKVFTETTGLPIESYHIETLGSPDITVRAGGADIKMTLDSDVTKKAVQLGQLMQAMELSERQNLDYVDMRFDDRAYACYKYSPCTKDPFIPELPTSTTTPLNATTSP